MAPLVSTIDINRPQHGVFAYVTDPSTFVEWQAGVVGGGMEGGAMPSRVRHRRQLPPEAV